MSFPAFILFIVHNCHLQGRRRCGIPISERVFGGGSGCGFDVRMISVTSCLLLSVFPGMKVVSIAHRMSGFGERGHEWGVSDNASGSRCVDSF